LGALTFGAGGRVVLVVLLLVEVEGEEVYWSRRPSSAWWRTVSRCKRTMRNEPMAARMANCLHV